jgi:hypothetical protein
MNIKDRAIKKAFNKTKKVIEMLEKEMKINISIINEWEGKGGGRWHVKRRIYKKVGEREEITINIGKRHYYVDDYGNLKYATTRDKKYAYKLKDKQNLQNLLFTILMSKKFNNDEFDRLIEKIAKIK